MARKSLSVAAVYTQMPNLFKPDERWRQASVCQAFILHCTVCMYM